MKKIFGIGLLLLVIIYNTAYADKGGIPFERNVKIFEPIQRALIAWNGEEEILLLSTDIKASASTKVLEVLPLPSEPVVKKGDVEVFQKAINLINKKLLYRSYLEKDLSRGMGVGAEKPPAGEVSFHEKIGAHDISVTHVLDSNGFISWVEKYLKSNGVDNPTIPEVMKTVVSEYLKEGFSWFVFDVVSLDEVPKTSEAIQYRFATKFLFYPLKISKTAEGDTSIEILVLTPRLLDNFAGIASEKVRLLHYPIDITSKELRDLNEEMDDLLGKKDDMKLRIWHIEGNLSEFNKDLIAR